MNYIDEHAKLICTDEYPHEDDYQLIDSFRWEIIRDKIRNQNGIYNLPFWGDLARAYSYNPTINIKGIAVSALLKEYSSPIFYDRSITEFQKMIYYVANDKKAEHLGLIIFNSTLRKVYFQIDNTTVNIDKNHVGTLNYVGGSFNHLSGTTVLASLHTHPSEEQSRRDGFSDQEIFDTQYRRGKNYLSEDGYSGRATKSPLYSIGMDNVDYYSPKGYQYSTNNLCSNISLINGSFNILKHALHEYCTLHPF